MKQKKTMKRIAAACGAVIIILILAVLVCSFYGAPWTHHNVKQKAEAYIKEKYPDISFTIKDSRFYAKTNQYQIHVTDTKHDHDFIVSYATATDYLSDSYYSETCTLIQREYQRIAAQFKQKLTNPDAYLALDILCNDDVMTLDKTFDPLQKEMDVVLSYQIDKSNRKHYTLSELKEDLFMLQKLAEAYPLNVTIFKINDSMEIPADKIKDDGFLEEMIKINESKIKELQLSNSK